MKKANLDRIIADITAGAIPPSTATRFPGSYGYLDFGLNDLFKKKSEPPKELTAVEALKVFSPGEAVKMNFIPQMLVALALDETATFVNYCREKRLSEFKKHNRVMRKCVEEYADMQMKTYGSAHASYLAYVGRYFDKVEIDRAKMWYSIGTTAINHLPEGKDTQVAVRIGIIHHLLDYAEAYDKKMDGVIQERLGKPISRRQDPRLKLIIAMCIAIEEDFGYKFEFGDTDKLNLRVLANRASMLADEILTEEGKCQ